VEGVDGLSIGRLAEHTGKSKSGLFAHFGSKEELQLAAIDTAEHIFDGDVVTSRAAPEELARLEALRHRFLSHERIPRPPVWPLTAFAAHRGRTSFRGGSRLPMCSA
jgi:AcrR family transcriptional regulator